VQFSNVSVDTEGSHQLYVRVSMTSQDNPGNNTAFVSVGVQDSDVEGPVISGVAAQEYGGDGDGIIGSDEQVRISYSLADASGIASTELLVDGSSVSVTGNGGSYAAVFGPLAAGSHQFEIRATDADDSPASTTNTYSFTIVEAERIALLYNGIAVTNGAVVPVDLGNIEFGSASERLFVVRNDGQQALILGVLTGSGGVTTSAPAQTNVTAGAFTYFGITPDTSTSGSFTGAVSLASSDSEASPFALGVMWRVVITDSDSDGIPDSWMQQYFGHPTGAASDNSRATDDADGTSQNNLFKYVAGLDPTDPASVFLINIVLDSSSSSLGDGLVAYYPLDGNANDASGNGKDGVNNGATPTPDRFGNARGAMLFDGTAIIDLQSSRSLIGVQNAFSISAWFNASGTSFSSIYRHRADYRDVALHWSLGGAYNLTWEVGAGQGSEHDVTVGPVPGGVWIHCVGTYDGSIQNLYTNGVLAASASWTGTVDWDQSFHGEGIGGESYTSDASYRFSGSIDDVRFYSRALTPQEVQQLYLGQSGGPPQSSLQFEPLATGRMYIPEFSTNLTLGGWSALTGYVGPVTNGNQATITDMNAVQPQKFYRIRISLP
jgi:hypothetical protein